MGGRGEGGGWEDMRHWDSVTWAPCYAHTFTEQGIKLKWIGERIKR